MFLLFLPPLFKILFNSFKVGIFLLCIWKGGIRECNDFHFFHEFKLIIISILVFICLELRDGRGKLTLLMFRALFHSYKILFVDDFRFLGLLI